MKNLVSIISLTILLIACGEKSLSGPNNGRSETPTTTSSKLSSAENALKEKLISFSVITQKELMKELLAFKMLKQSTLKNLDEFINVKCSKVSGLCDITLKD